MTEALNGKAAVLVGAGKMGRALLSGWLMNSTIDPDRIYVLEPNPSAELAKLKSNSGFELNPTISQLEERNIAAVVLAIKPQDMTEVLAPLKDLSKPSVLFISIAAGKTVASLSNDLGGDVNVVRAMPNLPASIGKGITALYAPPGISQLDIDLSTRLFEAVGEVVFLEDESHMDVVTAVSGSGPAYVFYLIECLTKAGVQAGLSEALAERLAHATVSGAGDLAVLSEEVASTLRENVTSKGGTTAAALEILMGKAGLEPLLVQAVAAAVERSRELAS